MLSLSIRSTSIYKTLIGFEAVFDEWSALRSKVNRRQGSLPEAKALEFANIDKRQTYATWRTRSWNMQRPNPYDLAIVPIFYKFLEHSRCSARLSVSLGLGGRGEHGLVPNPRFRGLWAGPLQEKQRGLLMRWINQGLYLRQLQLNFR